MQHIAILDFGSQYTHLIARRVRELGVLSKIYRPDIAAKELTEDIAGIILSGGPQSVYEPGALAIDREITKLGKPILGLCYGHQLLANMLGGTVAPGAVREYGRARLVIKQVSPLLSGLESPTTVWMSHGDTVAKLAPGFTAIGKTSDCFNAVVANEDKKIYGLQFHPEVHHTSSGRKILENFVINICQAEREWKIENLLTDLVEKIRHQAGAKNVFLLVSGGVDSTVCFALLEKALGKKRVFGLHIDTGFMRQDESAWIKKALTAAGYNNLRVEDARAIFYERLRHITDPEQKRKIIGQTFLDIKDKIAAELNLNNDAWLLGQGTIYPDTIESGSTRHADKIKTHHNRVDAIQEMISQGRVIEPLADFYKDEVRALGKILGLPLELINRHPFPGPGLAIRVLCNESPLLPARPPEWRKEKEGGVFIPSFPRRGRGGSAATLAPHPSPLPKGEGVKYQLLPLKSVGVQGDNRTYSHPLALWFDNLPTTGLSAEALVKAEGETDWEKLDEISSNITNTNHDINRILLCLNPQQDDIIGQLQTAYLTPERVELLRRIDAIVNQEIMAAKLYNDVWQFPVVLIPFGQDNQESIVLRPVVSQEAMTANFARLPKTALASIVDKILATDKISYVFYDITNKPPGTIEWE